MTNYLDLDTLVMLRVTVLQEAKQLNLSTIDNLIKVRNNTFE